MLTSKLITTPEDSLIPTFTGYSVWQEIHNLEWFKEKFREVFAQEPSVGRVHSKLLENIAAQEKKIEQQKKNPFHQSSAAIPIPALKSSVKKGRNASMPPLKSRVSSTGNPFADEIFQMSLEGEGILKSPSVKAETADKVKKADVLPQSGEKEESESETDSEAEDSSDGEEKKGE